MNRIISFLLKSAIVSLIVLFQLPVFAIDYYSRNVAGGGNFDDPLTWTTNTSTNIAVTEVNYDDARNNFVIRAGHTVKISTKLSIAINNLTISGVTRLTSKLDITSDIIGIVINGNLAITEGGIDFGTGNVGIKVMGNFTGTSTAIINQTPARGKAQQLILNGASNSVGSYLTNSGIAAGTSEVIYSGSVDQNIFASDYSTLTISGSPRYKKVLSGDIKVSNGLNLSDTYVQLDNNSLEYSGLQSNLNVTTGWVNTNGTGVYKNSNAISTETVKTFPVGNATASQKITLSDLNPKNVIEVSFNANPRGITITNGMGAWNVNTNTGITTSLSAEIYPNPDNTRTINNASKIASYTQTGINPWQVQPTTFSSTDLSYASTSTFNIVDGNTWLMIYNCPVYTISHTSPLVGYSGENYSETFVAKINNTNIPSSTIVSTGLPSSGFNFDPIKGLLSGRSAPTATPTIPFTLSYSDQIGCRIDTNFTLRIIALPSPNLSIANIDAKTFGADSFRVRTYSRSTGKITYTILSGGCATIDTLGFIKINCVPSNNQVTVTATQLATRTYRGESVSKSFIINPAPGRLYIKNFAFLASGPDTQINTITKSQPKSITFEQLTGFNEATVTETGLVDPHQPGEFTVHISLAATTNYTAFDSVYTFNVYTLDKPPVAVADTITLEMGTDSTFNILLNDRGQTSEIIPKNTDIDMENRGQQTRYYATELGNFIIDTLGNLTVIPFNGFIGSGRLGYTVTDLNGLSSSIAYVEVIIIPPYVVPELKVNTVMTPNGDNLNDALVIANTDLSKENSLIIIDQIGNTVYETTNYQNNWEGVDNKNNKLEPGVYFYTFKEKASGRELQNYIQIVK